MQQALKVCWPENLGGPCDGLACGSIQIFKIFLWFVSFHHGKEMNYQQMPE